MKPWCADGSVVFSVEMQPSAHVDDPQQSIEAHQPELVSCGAEQLKPYLAKKESSWLKDDAALDGIACYIMAFLRQFSVMKASQRLDNDACFDSTFTAQESTIHVLVQLPELVGVVGADAKRRKLEGTQAIEVDF